MIKIGTFLLILVVIFGLFFVLDYGLTRNKVCHNPSRINESFDGSYIKVYSNEWILSGWMAQINQTEYIRCN